ncbi:MAG TPA: hypothetical protein VFN11_14195, partial [Ktedonobacterales bacterium]|nr:hypothetical protein [Ktedonobacterales bacterium]
GRQYPSASAVLTEESAGKIAGPGDFAELVYPMSSLWGSGAPALHSGATTAYDWIWTPSLTASYANAAKTFTVQQGDTIDAEQYAFLVFHGLNYSINRKQEVTIGGDFMAQTFTDGITMTASPTAVQQSPMVGAQFNLYLDTTSTGLGVTQLLDVMKMEYKASGYYDGYWPVNRANQSYGNIVDKEKKHEVLLTVQANPTGVGFKANYLETGQRAYLRVNGTGPMIENDQTVGVGAASAGNFTLTYKGQTTANIAFNATNAAVQSALVLLSTIGNGNVVVSGTAPTWTVQFTGTLANDTTLLTGSGAGLTGGALTITAAPISAAFIHDMACFVTNMAEFSDDEGVYAVQYTLAVAEDTAWNTGQAQKITLTNLVSAL